MKTLLNSHCLVLLFMAFSAAVVGQSDQINRAKGEAPAAAPVCSILVDPRGYSGPYFLDKKLLLGRSDPQLVTPGFHYIEIGGKGYENAELHFTVSNDCKVRSYDSRKQGAVYSDNVVTFKNVAVEIDPQNFGGKFYQKGFEPRNGKYEAQRSNTEYMLLPNTGSFVEIYGNGMPETAVFFGIEENGSVTIGPKSVESATAIGNKVVLKTAKMNVEPITYRGTYNIADVLQYVGIQRDIVLVNGVNAAIWLVDNKFAIIRPRGTCIESKGACSPSVVVDVIDHSGNIQKFRLTIQ